MSNRLGLPTTSLGRSRPSSTSVIPFTIPPLRESISGSGRSASSHDLHHDTELIDEETDGAESADACDDNTKQRLPSVNGFQLHLYEHSECNDETFPQSRFGRIWYTILYDAIVETLTVKVIKVMQLPGRESNAPHDSFVKLYLLPDERMSQQTKVKRRTNNPKFNETFIFQASSSNIKERTLRLSVYDGDKRKVTKQLLGHALISLADVELLAEGDALKWKDLEDKARPGDSGSSLGDINLSLCYHPSMNRLTVVIIQARNLKDIDVTETGVRVTVSLSHGHRVVKKRETSMKVGEPNLDYNESFSFHVSSSDIDSSCISIGVTTHQNRKGMIGFLSSLRSFVRIGKLQATYKYGRVVVGSFMFCRGEQLLHWQEMLTQPDKTVTKWHPLSQTVNSS